jgi:type IV pilus assembly protein PilB
MTVTTKAAPTARLGDILVRQGVLAASRLEAALAEQRARGSRLGQVLVEGGYCTEEQIAQALTSQFRLEFVKAHDGDVDRGAAATLGLDFLRKHGLVPLRPSRKLLRLATSDPLEVEPIDRAQSILHVPLETVVMVRRDVAALLDSLAAAQATVPATDSPDGAKLLEDVFNQAASRRATDIHFEPDERSFCVRLRVDGMLERAGTWAKELAPLVVARVKNLAELDVCEHRLPQDGRVRVKLAAGAMDMRVSILPTVHGEACVIRVLDPNRSVLAPTALDMPQRVVEALLRLVQRPHGLVLVTGPTGSGKTTTLYSLLSTIDASTKKVITVEDPVEYAAPMVRQCQVKSAIGFTFAAALRSILRHDPEVVLIGEIRDKETAEIATRAALTGHLVLSTLHTNSAVGAVPRLLDMGIEPFLVASTVIGIVGQRLARRLCEACKTPGPLSGDERLALPPHLREVRDGACAPKGCPRCGNSGFRGRVGLYELVLPDERFRNGTHARASEAELLATAAASGFLPMSADGAEKVLLGITCQSEIDRVTHA